MNLIIPLLLSFIIDDVIPTGNKTNIFVLGFVMILASALCLVGDIIGNRMASKGSRNITRSLRHDLFTKITYLSEKQVDEIGIPSLVSRMTNDTYNLHHTIGMLQRMGVRAPILIIGGIAITMFLDPILSLILVAVFPLICLVVFFVRMWLL
jgi:ATP-binding cassette subfamily B protein